MRHWDWRARSIAGIVWPSFLTASVATVVFFAKMDPDGLLDAFVFSVELSHTAVYSIGFFFFWLVAAVASILSTLLIRTERRRGDFPTADDDT